MLPKARESSAAIRVQTNEAPRAGLRFAQCRATATALAVPRLAANTHFRAYRVIRPTKTPRKPQPRPSAHSPKHTRLTAWPCTLCTPSTTAPRKRRAPREIQATRRCGQQLAKFKTRPGPNGRHTESTSRSDELLQQRAAREGLGTVGAVLPMGHRPIAEAGGAGISRAVALGADKL